MPRFLVFLFCFLSFSHHLQAQWTFVPNERIAADDRYYSGSKLELGLENELYYYGIALTQEGNLGFWSTIDKQSGALLDYRVFPLDSGWYSGRVAGVVPELKAVFFEQTKYTASGYSIQWEQLVDQNKASTLSDFSCRQLSEVFEYQGDTLLWCFPRYSVDEIYQIKIGSGVELTLSESDLPSGDFNGDDLVWFAKGDSLYALYKGTKEQRLYAMHRAKLEWGSPKIYTLSVGNSLVNANRNWRQLPIILNSKVELDSTKALASHFLRLESLPGEDELDLEIKIRNPYILDNSGGGFWSSGPEPFVYQIDIERKGDFILLKTEYRPFQEWTRTHQRVILYDRFGHCYYDKLIKQGDDRILVHDLLLDSDGVLYISYDNWDTRERAIAKLALDGKHKVVEDSPLKDALEEYPIGVYPNPAHDQVWIDSQLDFPEGSQLRILGLDGQVRFTSFIRGINPTVVLPSNLSPGMYLLEVSHPRFGPSAEQFFVK